MLMVPSLHLALEKMLAASRVMKGNLCRVAGIERKPSLLAPWLTNGSASSIVAGSSALPQIAPKEPLPLAPIPRPTRHRNAMNNFTKIY
jgi:hypothetical protein